MGHHFVLVHGGLQGAWCWFKLVDRLQKAGHKVTALDLAGAGQHPADPNTINTIEEYSTPAVDFLHLFQRTRRLATTHLASSSWHLQFPVFTRLSVVRNGDSASEILALAADISRVVRKKIRACLQ
jgi:pimeloyl-ACP methyl ester carboxylesterase